MRDDDLWERLRTLPPEEQGPAISADMDEVMRFVRQGRAAQEAADQVAAHQRAVDTIARLAEAWDLEGRHPFDILRREHRALLVLANLPLELQRHRWDELTGAQREALLVAARRAVTLGRACAWLFGEGKGA